MRINKFIRYPGGFRLPKETKIAIEPRLDGQKFALEADNIIYLSNAMYSLYNREEGNAWIHFMSKLEVIRTSKDNLEFLFNKLNAATKE